MKKTVIALLAASLVSAAAFASENDLLVRMGFNGLVDGLFLSHGDDAALDAGAGFSGEYTLPFLAFGKQNGLGLHIDSTALLAPKSPVSSGTDVFATLGWWLRFPLGASDFAFQPELDYGLVVKKVDSAASTFDQLVQAGLSLRWNPQELANGHVEFELTPLVGVETFTASPSLYVGGRLGVMWIFGENKAGKAARARRAEAKIQALALEDVSIKMKEEGLTISLDNIHFQPDSAELVPEETAKLDKIAQMLKGYRNNLLITGHCAATADTDDDLRLSIERAQTVADYLLSKGVRTTSKVSVTGKGSSEPAASNDTEAGRAKNRRVEITLLER